uniref:non-specific serine/threonine protein kinase n=1 Tax=Hirondellea gigas TaxID=1518452 RepID=A0A6A7GDE1_9CRUS
MGNNLKKLRKEEILKSYDIKEKLGTGSFAVVKKGIRKKDGAEFALKIVKKKNLNAEELMTINDEVEIMNQISHKNVVRLIEIYDTPKNLYMVLELLNGGELFERIVAKGQYSEKMASELIRDIAGAIQYLHEKGVVHRDLKPENLMYASVEDDQIKITDFGLAKCLESDGQTMSTACGTPGYVAPEILKNEPYDKQVDLWSIGVILYILLCGFPPFYDENAAGLYAQIKRGEFDFPDPYWADISDQAKDLVSKLLTVDPKKRCSSELLLAHPWISQNAAPDKPLGEDFTKRLTKFNARRKLRRGIQMIMAVNRLTRAFTVDLEN